MARLPKKDHSPDAFLAILLIWTIGKHSGVGLAYNVVARP